MKTPRQRFKDGDITFNQMLKEVIARKFGGYKAPKTWEWLKARKEGYDFDYPDYLDGSENLFGWSEQEIKKHYRGR